MIERYDVPEVSAIWSDRARMDNWLEIELAAVEAWAVLGAVPKEDAFACRDRAGRWERPGGGRGRCGGCLRVHSSFLRRRRVVSSDSSPCGSAVHDERTDLADELRWRPHVSAG